MGSLSIVAVRDPLAERSLGGSIYARHRPEDTLLYWIIDENYGDFIGQLQAQGRSLPPFVRREFEEYLKCGRLHYGFLRTRSIHGRLILPRAKKTYDDSSGQTLNGKFITPLCVTASLPRLNGRSEAADLRRNRPHDPH